MFLDLFPSNREHEVELLLTLKAKLYDGSDLTMHAEDTPLIFETATGKSKIALRNVVSMKNISHVVTLRKNLWANRFEIEIINGGKLIGVPKSPQAIHLCNNGAFYTRGGLKLWEIDWLEVERSLQPSFAIC